MAAVKRLRVGTRGSQLALAQTGAVVDAIRARSHDVRVEVVEITTTGDRIVDVPLGPAIGSSFFTKEIEQALLDGRIDLAVHSCKDLATTLPDGLAIAAVPERASPWDVLVSRSASSLAALAAGARVGTSSPRRKAFIERARPDLVVVDQRGNVPTRVRAVDEEALDGAVLAAAGLERLGLSARIVETFGADTMLPAAGQGALAIQTRAGDGHASGLARLVDDAGAHAEVDAERACLRRLGAGCQAPVGALARREARALVLEAAVHAPEGLVRVRATGLVGDAESVGEEAAAELLGRLGLASLRDAEWAGVAPRASSSAS